jgi:hypothetical protein
MAKARKEGKPKRNPRNLKEKMERIKRNAQLIKELETKI